MTKKKKTNKETVFDYSGNTYQMIDLNLDPVESTILEDGWGSSLIGWCQPLKLPATSTISPSPQYWIST